MFHMPITAPKYLGTAAGRIATQQSCVLQMCNALEITHKITHRMNSTATHRIVGTGNRAPRSIGLHALTNNLDLVGVPGP